MATRDQRRHAIDNVRERLDVLVALARDPGDYPFERYLAHASEAIVDAVLALTGHAAVVKPFPWQTARGPVTVKAEDEQGIHKAIGQMQREIR